MVTALYGYDSCMHRPENVERQEEKKNGRMEINLERHLVIEFRLVRSIGDNFRAIAIAV